MIRDTKDKAVTSFAHTLFTVWTVSQYVTVQRQTVIMWMAAWNFQQVFAFEKLVGILLKERYTVFYINYTCINYHRLVKTPSNLYLRNIYYTPLEINKNVTIHKLPYIRSVFEPSIFLHVLTFDNLWIRAHLFPHNLFVHQKLHTLLN